MCGISRNANCEDGLTEKSCKQVAAKQEKLESRYPAENFRLKPF